MKRRQAARVFDEVVSATPEPFLKYRVEVDQPRRGKAGRETGQRNEQQESLFAGRPAPKVGEQVRIVEAHPLIIVPAYVAGLSTEVGESTAISAAARAFVR
jgi:hypothetical protein